MAPIRLVDPHYPSQSVSDATYVPVQTEDGEINLAEQTVSSSE